MAINTKPTGQRLQLTRVQVRPVLPGEEAKWNELMQEVHPLGNACFSGYHIKYVAEHDGRAVALLCVSGSAYHLADRDRWIGWSEEQLKQRRNFVVQNSRFLVLGREKRPNLASRVLAKCTQRLPTDWRQRFGFEPALIETFVDTVHFRGTCYKAAGWTQVGHTRGFRRDGQQFYSPDSRPKQIWLKSLRSDAAEFLRSDELSEPLRAFENPLPPQSVAKRLGAKRLRSLFETLRTIKDPRRGQGRKYPLSYCLAIAVCGVLAGCRGVRECAEMANNMTQPQLRTLRAWRNPKTGRYDAPCYSTLWRVISLVDAEEVEQVVSKWFQEEDISPEAVALDGKTLRATLQNEDGGLHVVSAVSHEGASPFLFRNVPTRRVRS